MTEGRRHHNNKGYRQIKNGRTREWAVRMEEKLLGKGRSWSLYCVTHGLYRGPISWGDDPVETPPCPTCGDATPAHHLEKYANESDTNDPNPTDRS